MSRCPHACHAHRPLKHIVFAEWCIRSTGQPPREVGPVTVMLSPYVVRITRGRGIGFREWLEGARSSRS